MLSSELYFWCCHCFVFLLLFPLQFSLSSARAHDTYLMCCQTVCSGRHFSRWNNSKDNLFSLCPQSMPSYLIKAPLYCLRIVSCACFNYYFFAIFFCCNISIFLWQVVEVSPYVFAYISGVLIGTSESAVSCGARPRCSLLCLFARLVNYTLSSFCGRSSMLSLLVSLEAMRPCHYVDICTLLHFRFLLACLSGISECRLRKKPFFVDL